jgi:hypothetical protein
MKTGLRGVAVLAGFFPIVLLTNSMGSAETVVKASETEGFPGGNPWNRPEGNVLWKIEIRRKTVPIHAFALRQMRGAVVHQNGEHAMVIARYPDHAVEYWSDGKHAVVSVAGSGDLVEYVSPKKGNLTPGGQTSPASEAHPDLADLARMHEWDWVKPDHFRGRLTVDGVAMLVFCQNASEEPAADTPSTPSANPPNAAFSGPLRGFPVEGVLRAALVEERSRTPRILQLGEEFWDYSFHAGEKPAFAFPEKVRRFLAALAPYFAGRAPIP